MRRERRLRLPRAAADQDFAAPAQPEIALGRCKIQEIPASADVAQLVEHFTRNEGVPGSSPGVGSRKAPLRRSFCLLGSQRPGAEVAPGSHARRGSVLPIDHKLADTLEDTTVLERRGSKFGPANFGFRLKRRVTLMQISRA